MALDLKHLPETESELYYFLRLRNEQIEHGKDISYIQELQNEIDKLNGEIQSLNKKIDKYKFIIKEESIPYNLNNRYDLATLRKIIREKDVIISKLLHQNKLSTINCIKCKGNGGWDVVNEVGDPSFEICDCFKDKK